MFGLPNPYLIGGAALAFALSVSGAELWGHSRGYSAAEKDYQLKIDKMVTDANERVQKAREAMLTQADAAITTLEAGNAKARVIYRTITQQVDNVVDRPVYRNVCLDDDGLRLANLALAGVAVSPPDPSKPDGGMPRVIAPQ